MSKPPLIIYAEVHEETRELVQIIFEREGFRVITTPDAETLIEEVNRLCVEDDCPDLILSDVNFFNAESSAAGLPKLTGIGAAYKINRRFPNLPILFLTAHDDRETKRNAREASDSDVLSKPFSPAELVSRVRDALRFQFKALDPDDRRKGRINSSGFSRRSTDRPIEVPRVVSEARAAAVEGKGQ
jgi:DNA-binding response OmpR family regulator